jgi:arabinogalactan endo-1,4-beta-galactosidase
MKLPTIACLLGLFVLPGCAKNFPVTSTDNRTPLSAAPTATTTLAASASSFAYGSDVSWVTQMEASGIHFFNNSGVQQDLFTILAGKGINAIRLRLWVNPSGGWCNSSDVVKKALRAKAAGMSVLIDFHYSDTWADPGHQTKPSAWASLSFTDLMTTTYNYTLGALNTLKSNGITPVWVQVGNETSNGMLWPDGMASTNMKQFAWLVNCGYNATKAVFPSCKVVVHLANGYDNTTFRWLFDGLKANSGSWDICGMSMYPTASNWSTLNTECLANMKDMVSRYGKQVMICEAGFPENDPTTGEAFLKDLIAKTKTVSGGLGLFYWEPEAYNSWQGYGSGAFGSNGEPTAAMSAF